MEPSYTLYGNRYLCERDANTLTISQPPLLGIISKTFCSFQKICFIQRAEGQAKGGPRHRLRASVLRREQRQRRQLHQQDMLKLNLKK